MGFSNEWDECYKQGNQISIWPWSDVVSNVYKYCGDIINNHETRVLELGCGAGANIPFFDKLGIQYYGIEGSREIVNFLHNKYPSLRSRIINQDFIEGKIFEEKENFDLIFDRAAITHNNKKSISYLADKIYDSLKINGIFMGIDWFSKYHSDSKAGIYVDNNTRTNIPEGQFKGVGNVFFSDVEDIKEIFKNFEILKIEEKKVITEINGLSKQFGSINFVCKK